MTVMLFQGQSGTLQMLSSLTNEDCTAPTSSGMAMEASSRQWQNTRQWTGLALLKAWFVQTNYHQCHSTTISHCRPAASKVRTKQSKVRTKLLFYWVGAGAM